MASAWPPFVTLHDKDTASDLTVEVWHRCCTEWKEETVTEKFWRDQGWVTHDPLHISTPRPPVAAHVPPSSQHREHDLPSSADRLRLQTCDASQLPHPDEDPAAKQNKMRKKKKNTARARKLRKALKSDYNPFSTVGKREADADDDQPNLVQSILDVDVETLVSAAPALFCSRETTPRGSPPPLQAPGLDVMREHIRLDTTLDVSNDLLMSVFGSLPPQLPPSGLAPEQLSMVGHLEYAVLTASLEQPSTSNQTGVSMASSLSSLGCERVLENILPAYETTAQLVFMDGLQRAGYGPRHFQVRPDPLSSHHGHWDKLSSREGCGGGTLPKKETTCCPSSRPQVTTNAPARRLVRSSSAHACRVYCSTSCSSVVPAQAPTAPRRTCFLAHYSILSSRLSCSSALARSFSNSTTSFPSRKWFR